VKTVYTYDQAGAFVKEVQIPNDAELRNSLDVPPPTPQHRQSGGGWVLEVSNNIPDPLELEVRKELDSTERQLEAQKTAIAILDVARAVLGDAEAFNKLVGLVGNIDSSELRLRVDDPVKTTPTLSEIKGVKIAEMKKHSSDFSKATGVMFESNYYPFHEDGIESALIHRDIISEISGSSYRAVMVDGTVMDTDIIGFNQVLITQCQASENEHSALASAIADVIVLKDIAVVKGYSYTAGAAV